MKEAIQLFEGEHNFKSFAKAADLRESYDRTILKTNISKKDNIIEISFIGTGFLRYMVRNMVGLLIEIGENKRDSKEISDILKAKDRRKSGKTAPSQGLYLKEVNY